MVLNHTTPIINRFEVSMVLNHTTPIINRFEVSMVLNHTTPIIIIFECISKWVSQKEVPSFHMQSFWYNSHRLDFSYTQGEDNDMKTWAHQLFTGFY